MKAIIIIAIILNAILSMIVLHFTKDLRWRYDKASLIGFWIMIFVYILNISILAVRL